VAGNLEVVAEIFTEGRIAVCFSSPDAMVDVDSFEAEPETGTPEEVEKGNGITAPGEAHEHPLSDQLRKAALEVLFESLEVHGSS
jgi:hypothetical protein